MEKCEGVESSLRAKAASYTSSPYGCQPLFPGTMFLSRACVFSTCVGKRMTHHPLPLTSITYLHLEEMRKTEDLAPFLTPATRLQKLYLQSLPDVQELPALDGLPSLYALKLYELHKLSDLSALSLSHLRYFAASLIADKLSRSGAGRCCDGDSRFGGSRTPAGRPLRAALWRCPKAFAAAGKSPALLREEISALSTWLSL